MRRQTYRKGFHKRAPPKPDDSRRDGLSDAEPAAKRLKTGISAANAAAATTANVSDISTPTLPAGQSSVNTSNAASSDVATAPEDVNLQNPPMDTSEQRVAEQEDPQAPAVVESTSNDSNKDADWNITRHGLHASGWEARHLHRKYCYCCTKEHSSLPSPFIEPSTEGLDDLLETYPYAGVRYAYRKAYECRHFLLGMLRRHFADSDGEASAVFCAYIRRIEEDGSMSKRWSCIRVEDDIAFEMFVSSLFLVICGD